MLQELIEKSQEYDQYKHDHEDDVRAFSFDEFGRMIVPDEYTAPLMLTDWATGQLLQKLAPAVYGKGTGKSLPRTYLTNIPRHLFADLMNDHIQRTPNKRWFVRGFDNSCRAVLSDSYSAISNTDILEVMQGVIDDEGNDFPDLDLIRPHVNADSVYVKLAWQDVNSGNYAIGTYLANGETGGSGLKLLPFIQRHACTNSIIYDHDEGVNLIHRGSPRAMMVQFKAAIGKVFNIAADMVDAMIEAEEQEIPALKDVITGIASKKGWDDDLVYLVFSGTEAQNTKAGLINGISYAAWSGTESPGKQEELEMLAGQFLAMATSEIQQYAGVR